MIDNGQIVNRKAHLNLLFRQVSQKNCAIFVLNRVIKDSKGIIRGHAFDLLIIES